MQMLRMSRWLILTSDNGFNTSLFHSTGYPVFTHLPAFTAKLFGNFKTARSSFAFHINRFYLDIKMFIFELATVFGSVEPTLKSTARNRYYSAHLLNAPKHSVLHYEPKYL